jgi:hypothetical protein
VEAAAEGGARECRPERHQGVRLLPSSLQCLALCMYRFNLQGKEMVTSGVMLRRRQPDTASGWRCFDGCQGNLTLQRRNCTE